MSSSRADEPRTRFERALVALLRPLARMLLNRGISHSQFTELAKRAYVESARSDFRVPDRKMTTSRIATLTGLTRKEVARITAQSDSSEAPVVRAKINRAARVVSAWVADLKYRDGRNAPASLPFDDDDKPSFSSLVSEHSGDVTPRSVLDELLRVGAVRQLKDGRYRLSQRAYVPDDDELTKLDILGTDVADLIASIENNLDPDREASFYQRKVAYDHLPAEILPLLRAELARSAQRLLEELNESMAKHDRDVNGQAPAEDRRRAMVGIYYYEDHVDDEE